MTNLWNWLNGKKTYILSILGTLIAIAGHFWGPLTILGQAVPAISTQSAWQVAWQSGLFAALRAAVGPVTPKAP